MAAGRTYFVPLLLRRRLQIVLSLLPLPFRLLHHLYLNLLFLPPIQGSFLKHQIMEVSMTNHLESDNNLHLSVLLGAARTT